MKLKFDTAFREVVWLILLTLAWSFWAGAQATNSSPPPPVTNAPPALVESFQRFEQPLTFRLDEVPFLREHSFLREPLWKYCASLIYILLAFCVAVLLDRVTRFWLKRLAARARTPVGDLLFHLFHGPIKVVAFVVLLNIGLNIFDWSPKAKVFLSKGLILVVAASLTYVSVKVVLALLEMWRRRHAQEADRKFDDQLFSVLRISLTAFIIVVAVLVTAQNLDVNITAALTSLSIGGLAVGLAAQDTLANLFGAVAVFVDKPFRVGDQIKLDGAEGRVEAVGLRSTRVRNPDGQLVAVPNKTIGNAIITNITLRPSIKTVMNLALAQDLPSAKVREALSLLTQIFRADPMTADVWISFNQISGGKLNILVVHWWKGTDYQKYLTDLQELNLTVKERFEQAGISLA